MTIKLTTMSQFQGIIHSRDYRRPHCIGFGESLKTTYLHLNLFAKKHESDYCGIFTRGVNIFFSLSNLNSIRIYQQGL